MYVRMNLCFSALKAAEAFKLFALAFEGKENVEHPPVSTQRIPVILHSETLCRFLFSCVHTYICDVCMFIH